MENFESMMGKQEGQFIFMNMQIYVFIILDAVFVQLLSCIWLLVTPRMQQARLPCPPLSPRVAQTHVHWCLNISPFTTSFSFCLQSFPASGSFPVSRLFSSGGQSIGASASASVLPMNIQGWFPLELTGLISLQSKGLSRVFSNTTVQKHQFFSTQLSL